LILLEELRRAGFYAQTDYRATTLKAHLRQADRAHCSFAILLGDDEVSNGSALLRNMESKAQEKLSLANFPTLLKARIPT
jgi:histidyl-tRNA synthetase